MKDKLLEDTESIDISTGQKQKCTFLTVFRTIIGITIILIGILIGIYISFLLMMISASSSSSRFLGYFVEFLIFLLISGCLTFIGILIAQFCKQNKIKQLFISSIIVLISYLITLIMLLLMFYMPVPKTTEFTNQPTGFWNLSTGSKIAYYKYGQNTTQKYPFVFIHGGPGAPVLGKEHFSDELASIGFSVFQYDQLGCGKSSRLKKVKDYTLERQIDDLESIREKIGTEKINIICHSFGGSLSSNYIKKYPNRVSQIVFISPGPICSSDHSLPALTKAGSIDQRKILFKNKRFLLSQLISSFFPPQGLFVMMSEKKLDDIFINFHDGLNMMPGSGSFYNTKGAGFGFWANLMTGKNMEKIECNYDALKKFDGMCLVVKGQFDYISFDVTAQFRDLIPNSVMITVDGMGHSVDQSHQMEIWKNIESFIINGTTVNEPYDGDVSPWNLNDDTNKF